MRIPAHKVYRAFPEFDRFDDARCEAYLAYLHRSPTSNLRGVRAILVILAFPGILLASVFSIFAASRALRIWSPGRGGIAATDHYWIILLACFLALSTAFVLLVLLLIRDAHLRSVVRTQLKGVRCQQCTYSLLGTPVVDGIVTCPECGFRFTIALRGLREEDFKVGADDLPSLVAMKESLPAPPAAPKHIELDPTEKQRMLQAIRERREGLTGRGATFYPAPPCTPSQPPSQPPEKI